MKAKEYNLLKDCIERGIGAGYVKAHKHTDKPIPENIWDTQVQYVMNEISEWFDFDEVKE